MYNFSLLEKARTGNIFAEMPFVNKYRQQVQKNKPYQGLKILQNVPLTYSTIFKVEALALGGAEVTSYISKVIPPDQKAIDVLQQANFKVVADLNFAQQFDFHLDCCAELLAINKPRLGAVELTQSGSRIYQQADVDYPVVSVDDSKLKVLETFLGTGDGFRRALQGLAGDNVYAKPYTVFGFGKVGKGIIYALQKFSKNICVVDLESSFTNPKPGIEYINAEDIDAVKRAVASSFAVVTATGKRNILSDFYGLSRQDCGDAILINMGAEDEYGPNFHASEVEFSKKPFNFSLEMPTALRYIDPIFYAHNIAMDIILANDAQTGYNPFPDSMAMKIIDDWHAIYKEPVAEAISSF